MSTESSPTGAGDTGASTGAGTGDPTEGESGGPVAPTTGATTSGDPTGPGTTGATGGTTDEPGTTGTTTGGPAGPARIVGYFISWGVYDRDYHVAEIPAQRLTHVNYAFANLADDGTCILGDPYADVERLYDGDDPNQPLKDNFNQLLKLKQQHPHLRTLISVGGYTWSSNFSPVAATEQGRKHLAATCVQFMRDYGFDGIDVDWEYPSGPADKVNFTLLLAALRAELDQAELEDSAEYLLTIAAPAGLQNIANLELDKIPQHLDWVNLMGYDFTGPWMPTTGLNAPLYTPADDPDPGAGLSDHAAVGAYLQGGVPPDKLVLGVPFYGRSFAGVPAGADGLWQTFTGPGPGTWEPGFVEYHDIAANYVPKYTRHFHRSALVPWLYDPQTQLFITYDDPESMQYKADYILREGLGGAMFWELSSDTPDGALLGVLADALLP